MFSCIFASEIVPISQLNIYFMVLSFNDLKYLITVVSEDLGNDDFDNFQDSNTNPDSLSEVSEEMYDKVSVLGTLLMELYKHRPLPF